MENKKLKRKTNQGNFEEGHSRDIMTKEEHILERSHMLSILPNTC